MVITHASDCGVGVMFFQDEHPIAFESQKLSPAESCYHISKKDMLAVVHALRTWRCYLEGFSFVS